METKRKWLGPESNQRHKDFQSSALPTELPSHKKIKLQERPIRNLPGSFFKTNRFDCENVFFINKIIVQQNFSLQIFV